MRKKIKNIGVYPAPLFKILKSGAGFTLVEVLIATAIFIVVVTTAVATFGFGSDLQTKTLALREASQNARFIMEAIARDIRMADSFTIESDDKIDIVKGSNIISYTFIKHEDDQYGDIEYFDGINREKLNGENLNIIMEGDNKSEFIGIGEDIDNIQSYVTIKIAFRANIGKSESKILETSVQTMETTVSTRAYTKGYEGKITSEEE